MRHIVIVGCVSLLFMAGSAYADGVSPEGIVDAFAGSNKNPVGELRTASEVFSLTAIAHTGDISTPEAHRSILFPDGRILMLGEETHLYQHLWSPKRQEWRLVPGIKNCPIGTYSSILLDNGKVMLSSFAATKAPCIVNSILLWDAATEQWEVGPELHEERSEHISMQLADGNVLIIGGRAPIADSLILKPLSSVELFDGTAVKSMPPLKVARFQFSATRLRDGRVLVAGGANEENHAIASVEIWDPVAQAWQDGPVLPTARQGHIAILLPDGNLMIAGGDNESDGAIAAVDILDVSKNQWMPASPLPFPARDLSATVLNGGDVLVAVNAFRIGEYHDIPIQPTFALLWEKATGQWKQAGIMTPDFRAAAIAPLPDGDALVFGEVFGETDFRRWRQPYVLRWSRIKNIGSPVSIFGRRTAVSTQLRDGRLLLAGGGYRWEGGENGQHFIPTDAAEIFDPASGQFTMTGRLNQLHAQHALIELNDGRVLAAGGWAVAYDHPERRIDASSEVWDPGTGQWHVLGDDLRFALDLRVHFNQLDDGQVLFFAVRDGDNGNPPEYLARIWDPATNKVTTKNIGVIPKRNTDITVMQDGRVLIVDSNESRITEWDARNGSIFSFKEPLLENSRWRLLPIKNGQVLMVSIFAGDKYTLNAQNIRSTALIWDTSKNEVKQLENLPGPIMTDGIVAKLRDGSVHAVAGIKMYRLAAGYAKWEAVPDVPFANYSVGPLPFLATPYLKQVTQQREGQEFAYWDVDSRKWLIYPQGYIPRKNPALAVLPDGRLMVAGGTQMRKVQLWDPKENRWTTAAPLLRNYDRLQAVALPSGRVLLAGYGSEESWKGGQYHMKTAVFCELWLPEKDAWIYCGDFKAGSNTFRLSQFDDGRAILLYGDNGISVYDDSINEWRPARAEIVCCRPVERWHSLYGEYVKLLDEKSLTWVDITALTIEFRTYRTPRRNALKMKSGHVLLSDFEMMLQPSGNPVFPQYIGPDDSTIRRHSNVKNTMISLADGCVLSWPPYVIFGADGMQFSAARGPHIPVLDASLAALPDGTVVFAGMPDASMGGSNPGFAHINASCKGIRFVPDSMAALPGDARPHQTLTFGIYPPPVVGPTVPLEQRIEQWRARYEGEIMATALFLMLLTPFAVHFIFRRLEAQGHAILIKYANRFASGVGIAFVVFILVVAALADYEKYMMDAASGVSGSGWVPSENLLIIMLAAFLPLVLYMFLRGMNK